jgi:hypothetical protein
MTLILILNLVQVQDTLKTVESQIIIGLFIKTKDQHLVFSVNYEKEPLLILKEHLTIK